MRLLFTLFILCLSIVVTSAQNTDSIRSVPDTALFKSAFRKKFSSRWHQQPHSPFKATVLSMALPGFGQIYNGTAKKGSLFRKYWKVPIVWGGIATCVRFIDYNAKNYRFFRNQYVAAVDDDPTTIPTESSNPQYLNEGMNYFSKLLDISYISLIAVYMLQSVEANVDAHLFYYDISNDLSMRWHPACFVAGSRTHGIGITFQF